MVDSSIYPIFAPVNKMLMVMKIVNTAFFGVFDATGNNVFIGYIGQCDAFVMANMERLLTRDSVIATISTFDVDDVTNTVVPVQGIVKYVRRSNTVYIINIL